MLRICRSNLNNFDDWELFVTQIQSIKRQRNIKSTTISDVDQSYEFILYLYSLRCILSFSLFRWIFCEFSPHPLVGAFSSFCCRSVTVDSLAEITRTCFGHYSLLGWKMFSMDNSHRLCQHG